MWLLSQDKQQLKINSNVDIEMKNLEIYNCHWREMQANQLVNSIYSNHQSRGNILL